MLVTFSLLVWQFLICCCCCSLSHIQLFASTRPPCPSYLPESAQTHVHWVDDVIQPSHPLFPPPLLLPSIFIGIRVFSRELVFHIRWPQYQPSINSLVLSLPVVQLSHRYMTTGKTIALTLWTFAGRDAVYIIYFNSSQTVVSQAAALTLPRNC